MLLSAHFSFPPCGGRSGRGDVERSSYPPSRPSPAKGEGVGVRLALFALLALLAGCRQDMHDQPRYEPFERSGFFDDQRASRPLVAGVVARGHLDEDTAFFTGRGPSGPVAVNPLPISRETLLRGRQRYDIYCSPCHDRVGSGEGMIVQRGLKQ